MSIRFFTSASLRPIEEIPGETTQWLPRWIAVEFDGERPLTGVWRSAHGARRVCWYAPEVSPELVAAHDERYGDEPFWVIDLSRLTDAVVSMTECDGSGLALARHVWTFDRWSMPLRDERRDSSGPIVTSKYRCLTDGFVLDHAEQIAAGASKDYPRPHRFPIPELAGEPYPCGGTIGRDGPRIIETIQQNQYQGRYYTVYQAGGEWRRGLATVATSKGWKPEIRPLLDFADPGVAPLVRSGELYDPRRQGYTPLGLVEALPDGRDLDAVIQERPRDISTTLTLALEVAAVAGRAHARGHQLGGIRPELVFVREGDGGLALTQIAHRGPAIISQYYGGEAILFPSVYAADFSSPDDATGLAQLVWYMLTGGHPFLATENLRWDDSWQNFRHKLRRRQPWTGPALLEPLFERALFGPSPMEFGALVAELTRLQAAR